MTMSQIRDETSWYVHKNISWDTTVVTAFYKFLKKLFYENKRTRYN